MGQKVNPHGFRVGVIMDWDTRWYAKKQDFSNNLVEDVKLRAFLDKKLKEAQLSKVEIEKTANRVRVNLFTGKPGMVIGRSGAGVEILKKEIEELTGKTCILNIMEIRQPELDARLVAADIADRLARRISFRRAVKQAIQRTMKAGAKGIKVNVSGRLGGAEIARNEHYHEGSIPLQTLRANIDYGFTEAATTMGRIGVKVWIYKGEVLPGTKLLDGSTDSSLKPGAGRSDRRRPMGDRRPGGDRRPDNRNNGNRGDRRAPRPSEGGVK